MFGSSTVGTEHVAFALAEGDDAVATAWAESLDRNAIRERLGVAHGAPSTEMAFAVSAKRAIEFAFENARRLSHNFIGTPHLALGVLATDDPPPLIAGVDLVMLRARLDAIAEGSVAVPARWTLRDGPPHPFVRQLVVTAGRYDELGPPGTRITLTVTPPAGPARTWAFEREPDA